MLLPLARVHVVDVPLVGEQELLVMSPGAGRCARVLRVAAQLVINRLPRLLADAAVIAALVAHLLEEHVEINCNEKLNVDFMQLFKNENFTLFESEHGRPFDRSVPLLHKSKREKRTI